MRVRAIARSALARAAGLALISGLLTSVGAVQATAQPESGNAATAAGPAESTATGGSDGVVIDTEGAGTGLWVVQLEEPSLAAYPGGIDALAPTSPQVTGAERLDARTTASEAYLDHLATAQDDLLEDIDATLDRSVDVAFRYRTVVNGVAVEIDDDEAAALAAIPGVAAVYRDVEREMQTDVSHDVLHSPAVWNGETGADIGTRGEGVVVGIIDSGINPSHPSFAATDSTGYTHTNPYGTGNYVGVCDPDHSEHEDICNDKLIGAWNFHPTAPDAQDDDSHGSHVAGTTAGNVHEATFSIDGDEFTRTIQGVAPHANVISYLVCSPSCPGTSSVAAVEQAILDEVDVLNYSISGAVDPWSDIVDRAFLEAFNAGIFVAAAAGNEGPGPSTTAHVGPWNAATAALTMSRAFVNLLDVTGPGTVPTDLTGLAVTPGDGTTIDADIDGRIIDAHAVDPANADGCAAFPAGAFDGALALIDRGTCPFADKILHAEDAGATGVVVSNDVAGPPSAMGELQATSIPAVMIDKSGGTALRDFLAAHADENPTVRIAAETSMVVDEEWADVVAGFSSRGPARFDVATPTFAAPGVNVLAAAAAAGSDPDQYAVLGGTSMASPHAAGSGALMTALHPDWSPAQILSALSSTARTDGIVKEDGVTPADAYDIGAGQIDLATASTAGLVLDESHSDFLAADPGAGGDPTTLNVPFAVNDQCAGTCTFTRTVENVADVEATYTADVTAPAGLSVTAEPATFTLVPGATQTIEVTVDVTAAEAGTLTFGEIGFTTDATHANGRPIAAAHLPLMITPIAVRSAITLDPGRLAANQGVDDVTTRTLTVGNTGNADLTWALHTDQALRTPRGPSTIIDTVDRSAARSGGDESLTTAPGADDAAEVVIPERSTAEDDLTQTITHSQSQAVMAGNAVACGPDDGATTSDNAYLRTFTLADLGIVDDLDVTEVEFGIESITGNPLDLTVNVYTMVDPDGPLTYANLERIGTTTQTFGPQELTLATVPVAAVAPAGSTLVVEVSAPDSRGASGFWPGSNSAGQTAPSYLRSDACGTPEPTDLAEIGFPEVHLVMNVTGRTGAPVCTAPADTPWLGVAPTSGTVAPAGHQDVAITFDATGLALGVYEATLCVESNDPRRQLAAVPVTLEVGAQPVIEVQPASLDIAQDAGTIAEHAVTVGNSGEDALRWQAVAEATECGSGQDVPWLTASPTSGAVDPGGSADLTVAVDSSLLEPEVYTATLCVTSNDPITPVIAVPVTLTVGDIEEPHLPAHVELIAADGQAEDAMGNAVAIDGDTAVVGASQAVDAGFGGQGVVRVYSRTDSGWTQQATLRTEDANWGTRFGGSVAVDGDTIVVGSTGTHVGDLRPGAAYVFVRDGDTWTLQQRLTGAEVSSYSEFGSSVAIDGDTVLVGAHYQHIGAENGQGAAYTFTREGGTWTQQQQLLASDGESFNNFGRAVTLEGSTAVITAHAASVGNFREGAAYVFEHTDAGWTEQAKLTASDGQFADEIGTSVDIDGDTVIVGGANVDVGTAVDQGAAYVFGRSGDGWAELAKLTVPGAAGDNFGASVTIEGATAVVGAPFHGAQPGFDLDRGAAFLFEGSGRSWARRMMLVASDSVRGDLLGSAVAVAGDEVLVGAPGATVDGHDRRGTAYVFTPSEAAPNPPRIGLTPDDLAPTVTPGGSTTGSLTIANTGEQDLTWRIGGDASTTTGILRPTGPSTDVETPAGAEKPAADAEWTVDDAPTGEATVRRSTAADLAEDPEVTTLTHSASMDIMAANTVVCASNEDGTSRENRGLRTFTLPDFGVDGDFAVSEVTFGVESVTVQARLTVNLYTLDGPLTYDNVTRIASETVTLDPQELALVTVPITATVPAGSTLVAEVVTPDLQGVGRVYLGSNDAGETAPSYISSEPCGTSEPTSFESLGFPNVQLVMAVSGVSVEPIDCALPAWLAADPASGTVAPGADATVEVSFDATGLAVGEYTAHLCVTSNDPATPTVTVPATLTVAEKFTLTAEARKVRGDWYADLAWTGAPAEEVDIYRDGELLTTVGSAADGTGTYTDALGKPKRGPTFSYQLCVAGTSPGEDAGTCSDPVQLDPRKKAR